jgi:hypothetical protein
MTKKLGQSCALVCAVIVSAFCALPASAQTQEVKEKPRMYTYVAFWTIPRAQWADEAKNEAAEQKFTEKGMADGQLVAYGSDQNLVHTVDGATHDTWFSSMSMAGLLDVLDQVYKSGMPTGPVQAAAPRHWDQILVTRYYNWHPGAYKDVYTYVMMFNLKPSAPEHAIDMLSQHLFVPVFEKLLADGTIHEYEIDTEAVHTDAPGTVFVDYIAANAESIDKVNEAIRESDKNEPLGDEALFGMINLKEHRDYLVRTNAMYK